MKKKIQSSGTVIEEAQLHAIESILMKTPEFFERRVRRWFSTTFSTPYLETFKITWPVLLLHFYESRMEEMEYNEVFELAKSDYLPEFMKQAEDADQAFADSLLDEQKQTLNKKKSKDKLSKSTDKLLKSAENVSNKAQSLTKKLDQATLPKPKAMSLKFDMGDPEKD